ncbi:recombinase family protein [Haliea sp.]|jgi:DNA invertase Pin-like site-specific DNA recombinase|uniref:recombinase family protein n=1 Tax=Haliea sp. TaxID=1932666 RepID=UPI000C4B08E9|nr:recombinase family protein [Haliea sp.]MAD65660.1 resolvase [Haliea sp.]|tara:strand:+ start:6223 stop:6813 length:591 start_codon:yes stop_codon:yes gene_type:complete
MKIGYARISTKDQNFESQDQALKNEGCEKIYRDVVSGAKKERPGLNRLLSDLRRGDILVVYKLDRLGRSLSHLVQLIETLGEKGVYINSLSDKVDTSSASGRLIMNVVGAIAEFERELIRERTKAGLSAARARGKQGGRPAGLSKEARDKAILAEVHYQNKERPVNEIIQDLGISKATFYKYLRYRGVKLIKSTNK